MEEKMSWIYYKVEGNGAFYVICPECGFTDSCYSMNEKREVELDNIYNYCPICGTNHYEDDESADVIMLSRFPRSEEDLLELGVKPFEHKMRMRERAKREKEKVDGVESIYCSKDTLPVIEGKKE